MTIALCASLRLCAQGDAVGVRCIRRAAAVQTGRHGESGWEGPTRAHRVGSTERVLCVLKGTVITQQPASGTSSVRWSGTSTADSTLGCPWVTAGRTPALAHGSFMGEAELRMRGDAAVWRGSAWRQECAE